MKKNVLLIFVVFTIASCGKQPVSDFTWSPQNPVAGEEVHFINASTNAKSYDWNLGDMNISSDDNPTHVYEMPGNYIIDLLARSGLKSDEKTVTITISE